MSATWSTSCTVALYISPLVSFTRTPLLLATTWALVTMRPSLLMMKPEPLDTGTSLPENGCLENSESSWSHSAWKQNVLFGFIHTERKTKTISEQLTNRQLQKDHVSRIHLKAPQHVIWWCALVEHTPIFTNERLLVAPEGRGYDKRLYSAYVLNKLIDWQKITSTFITCH